MATSNANPCLGAPCRSVAPEQDAQAGEAPEGARDPAGDRRAGGSTLGGGDGEFVDAEARLLGPDHELGVEQVGVEPAPGHQRRDRGPVEGLDAVGVGDAQPKPDPQDGAEHPGHEAAERRTGVARAGGALGADDDRRWRIGRRHRDDPVDELEVVVVDVEVHDEVAAGGEQPGAQRPSVVGLGQRQHPQIRDARRQLLSERDGAVGRAVLDDHHLEVATPGGETGDHVGHGRLQVRSLVVGREDHGSPRCGPRWSRPDLRHVEGYATTLVEHLGASL